MDENSVREHAEAHGQAVVAGDLRKAGSDLTREGAATAQEVMSKLPAPVTSAEVLTVEAEGDEYVAQIRYRGADAEATVASRWAEHDGRPKIVELRVV